MSKVHNTHYSLCQQSIILIAPVQYGKVDTESYCIPKYPWGVNVPNHNTHNKPKNGSQLCVIGNRKYMGVLIGSFTEVLINRLNCPWNALVVSDFMYMAR
jgi:hypothetical protein